MRSVLPVSLALAVCALVPSLAHAATTCAMTGAQLKSQAAAAAPGDTVQVDATSTIDLTGIGTVVTYGDVTIEGVNGCSGGPASAVITCDPSATYCFNNWTPGHLWLNDLDLQGPGSNTAVRGNGVVMVVDGVKTIGFHTGFAVNGASLTAVALDTLVSSRGVSAAGADLDITFSQLSGPGDGIYAMNSSEVTVENNIIVQGNRGVFIRMTSGVEPDVYIYNNQITGTSSGSPTGIGVFISGSYSAQGDIEANQITGLNNGIYFYSASTASTVGRPLISRNVFTDGTGIRSYQTQVRAQNNRHLLATRGLVAVRSEGWFNHNSVSQMTLDGVFMSGGTVQVSNSVFDDIGGRGIRGASTATEGNNVFFNIVGANVSGGIVNVGPTYTGDPELSFDGCTPMSSSSSVVDRADPTLGAVVFDHYLNTRPTLHDIGACEYF